MRDSFFLIRVKMSLVKYVSNLQYIQDGYINGSSLFIVGTRKRCTTKTA